MDKVLINGVEYEPTSKHPGTRAVVVVDRGWIFAGDVSEACGRVKLERAVWVFSWDSIGFDGVLANPASPSAKIKRLQHTVDLPADAEVFRVPVSDDWGL